MMECNGDVEGVNEDLRRLFSAGDDLRLEMKE